MNKMLIKGLTAAMLVAFSAGAMADIDNDKLPKPREVKGKNGTEGEIYGDAKPGSPFSKIEIGMPQKQVSDLIGGRDADCGSYITGKAWIPFHFGGDKYRTECAYKGLGRLIFTSNSDFDSRAILIKIINDPSEDGYR